MRKLLIIIFVCLNSVIYSQNFRVIENEGKRINLQVYISLTSLIINNEEYKLDPNNWVITQKEDRLSINGIEYFYNKEQNNHVLIYNKKTYQMYENNK